jgi:hypothetical protein
MYSNYQIDMAKEFRQRDIKAAKDHRLAREARAERTSDSSGIGAAAGAAIAATARLFHITRAHPHKA